MAGRPIVVSVVGDTRGLTRDLGQAEGRLGKFGRLAGGVGKAVGAGLAVAGVAAVGFAVKAVKSASDAQQSLGATETVFGRYASTVVKNSDRAAQAVGLSANEYRESANLIGSLFKNQGVASDQLAGKTDKMVRMGADLAATFGGKTSEAVEALGSAFKGEFDPLERYGISLKQSTINAELAARGEDKLTGAALKAAQQRATTAIITRQAKDSLGAFGRESNTLAGQQQRLGASWENIKAKVGSGLLPILTRLAAFANEQLLPGIVGLVEPAKALGRELGERMGAALTAAQPLLSTIGRLFTGTLLPALQGAGSYLVSTFGPVFRQVFSIIGTQVVPIVMRLGTFLYGTLYPAIVAVVTQVAGRLRPVFTAVAQALQAQVLPAVSALLTRFRAALPTILAVAGVVVKVTGKVLGFAAAILGKVLPPLIRLAGFLIGATVRAIGVTISAVTKIIQWVGKFGSAMAAGWKAVKAFSDRVDSAIRALPGRIKSALGNAATWLVSKGRDFISGLIKGVRDKLSGVSSSVRDVIGKAKDALSGAGSALVNAGRNLINGLISGIGERIGAAVQKVRDGLSKIRNMLPGSPIKEGPLKSWNRGGAGRRLIDMLASGLRQTRPLEEAMTAATRKIARLEPGVAAGAIAPARRALEAGSVAGGAFGGGVTVNLTVQVPLGATGADVGREAVKYIQEYYAAGGARL